MLYNKRFHFWIQLLIFCCRTKLERDMVPKLKQSIDALKQKLDREMLRSQSPDAIRTTVSVKHVTLMLYLENRLLFNLSNVSDSNKVKLTHDRI